MNLAKMLSDKIDKLTAALAADVTYRKARVDAYRIRTHAAAEKRCQEFADALDEKRNGRAKKMVAEREKLTAALAALGTETPAVTSTATASA